MEIGKMLLSTSGGTFICHSNSHALGLPKNKPEKHCEGVTMPMLGPHHDHDAFKRRQQSGEMSMTCDSVKVTELERGYLLFLCSHAEAAIRHITSRRKINFTPDYLYPCMFSDQDQGMVGDLCARGLVGIVNGDGVVPTQAAFELLGRKWPG